MKKIFTLCLLLCLCAPMLRAQLIVQNVDLRDFPVMRASVHAFDKSRNPVFNLKIGDFSLSEDSSVRTIDALTVPVKEPVPLSAVIMLDATASANAERQYLVHSAAEALIARVAPPAQAALMSFNTRNFLHQDFTVVRDRLLAGLDQNILPQSAANYETAFMGSAGVFDILRKSNRKNIAFLISDGNGAGDIQKILAEAQKNKLVIYGLGIRHRFSAGIRDMIEKSGGLVRDTIMNEEQAVLAALEVFSLAQELPPFELQWRSEAGCSDTKNIYIAVDRLSMTGAFSYMAPSVLKTVLTAEPPGIRLNFTKTGTRVDTVITVSAVGGDIQVENIISTNPAFTVSFSGPPFVLPEGQSRTIAVSYLPESPGQTFTEIQITSSACETRTVAVVAGLPEMKSSDSLRVTYPNGKERFRSGEYIAVRWRGVLPQDTIILQYSTNGGSSWELIADTATGLRYDWLVPRVNSSSCIIRAIQQSGRVIILEHPDKVDMVQINPDGTKVLSSCHDRKTRLWDAVQGKLIAVLDSAAKTSIGIFSHKGDLIATSGGDDDTISLRRTEEPETVINTIEAPVYAGHRYGIAFSPDDSLIAISYNGNHGGSSPGKKYNKAKIQYRNQSYELNDSDLELIIRMVKFNHDGTRIFGVGTTTAQESFSLDAWNTGDILNGRDGRQKLLSPFKILGFDLYPTGGKMIVSLNGSLNLYTDRVPSELLRQYDPLVRYYDCKFSPDGSKIFAGSFAKERTVNGVTEHYATISVFDTETGTLLRSLREHNDDIYDVAVSANGKFLASASADRTVRIWDLFEPQDDESDSAFSINFPQAAVQNTDMGRVWINALSEKRTLQSFCNSGTIPLRIDSIQTGSPAFALSSGIYPEIAPGECAELEFRFSPVLPGTYSDSVRVFFASDTLSFLISGEGIKPSVQAVSMLDFGKVPVRKSKELRKQVLLKNISGLPLEFGEPLLNGDPNITILGSTGKFTLAPGEEYSLDLVFSPQEDGRTMALLSFSPAGIDSPVVVPVHAEGICGPADEADSVYVRWPRPVFPVEIGQEFSLPVSASARQTPLDELPTEFSFELRFNKSVLYPLPPTPLGRVEGRERVIEISGRRALGDSLLTSLKFIAALGDSNVTVLSLSNFSWDGCTTNMSVGSALVNITDACITEGMLRKYIESQEPAVLIAPNPSGGVVQIGYTLIEPGETSLMITNMLGERVLNIREGYAQPGSYIESWDIGTLSSGVYYIVLRTPTQVVTRRIERTK